MTVKPRVDPACCDRPDLALTCSLGRAFRIIARVNGYFVRSPPTGRLPCDSE